jgi:ribosomal protein S14
MVQGALKTGTNLEHIPAPCEHVRQSTRHCRDQGLITRGLLRVTTFRWSPRASLREVAEQRAVLGQPPAPRETGTSTPTGATRSAAAAPARSGSPPSRSSFDGQPCTIVLNPPKAIRPGTNGMSGGIVDFFISAITRLLTAFRWAFDL